MSTRRVEFSAKTKVAAFERSRGHCECCTVKLFYGKIEYDHEIPCELGGDNSLENCRVLCVACHRGKTSTQDIPRIAKAKRNYRKSIGIKKPSRFAASRNSPFKKKLDGSVVRR